MPSSHPSLGLFVCFLSFFLLARILAFSQTTRVRCLAEIVARAGPTSERLRPRAFLLSFDRWRCHIAREIYEIEPSCGKVSVYDVAYFVHPYATDKETALDSFLGRRVLISR